MTPELTHRPLRAAAVDATPVFVSRDVLKLAALNLLLGAGAMWAAANLPGPFATASFGAGAWNAVAMVLLFVPVAALLPLQALLLTRPLLRDVTENSVAPAVLKAYAAAGVSAGSFLTAIAYGRVITEMCSLA